MTFHNKLTFFTVRSC